MEVDSAVNAIPLCDFSVESINFTKNGKNIQNPICDYSVDSVNFTKKGKKYSNNITLVFIKKQQNMKLDTYFIDGRSEYLENINIIFDK